MLNTLSFKKYIILKEKIEKSDIIDLYIIMAMPEIDSDPAYSYVIEELKDTIVQRIIKEAQHVVLRELRHLDLIPSTAFFERLNIAYHTNDILKTPIQKFLTRLQSDPLQARDNLLFAFSTKLHWDNGQDVISNIAWDLKHETLDIVHMQKYFKLYNIEQVGKYIELINYLVKIFKTQREFEGDITFKDVSKAISQDLSVEDIERMFLFPDWLSNYGGKNWANIAHLVGNLMSSPKDKLLYHLDRFVDTVHNTGSIANKFQGSEEGWLFYILDLKAYATNIRELIPYASYDVQKLFRSQEWRMALMNQPGKGASESFTAEIGMLKYYINYIYQYYKNYHDIPGFSVGSSAFKQLGLSFDTNRKFQGFIMNTDLERINIALNKLINDQEIRKKLKIIQFWGINRLTSLPLYNFYKSLQNTAEKIKEIENEK